MLLQTTPHNSVLIKIQFIPRMLLLRFNERGAPQFANHMYQSAKMFLLRGRSAA